MLLSKFFNINFSLKNYQKTNLKSLAIDGDDLVLLPAHRHYDNPHDDKEHDRGNTADGAIPVEDCRVDGVAVKRVAKAAYFCVFCDTRRSVRDEDATHADTGRETVRDRDQDERVGRAEVEIALKSGIFGFI